MKYLQCFFALSLILASQLHVAGSVQLLLPTDSDTIIQPSKLGIDSLKATAHWSHPEMILLNEDFETFSNLPSNWQSSSNGNSEWEISSDAGSINFFIPGHSRYAACNDFNAGALNDGCCDRLITPFLNLTLTDSVVMSFNSFFTGAFNEKATVEISLDAGLTWHSILELDSSSVFNRTWESITLNLSPYTSYIGASLALLAFHADDRAQQASGWAIDDISVVAYASGLQYYSIWLNDDFQGLTTNTDWTFPPGSLNYSQSYKCEVAANYISGQSASDSVVFVNYFLPFPTNMSAQLNMSSVMLYWSLPDFGNTGLEASLLHYNLYMDDSLYTVLPPGTSQYIMQAGGITGIHEFSVSASYDLDGLGFPGMTGESAKSSSGEILFYYTILPLFEDWIAGSFNFNSWTAGQNWTISQEQGIEPPAALFLSSPGLINYESSLVAFPRVTHEGTGTPVDVILEFDLKLTDNLANGTEFLSFVYTDQINQSWDTITRFMNHGDSDWTHYKLRLNYPNSFGTVTLKIVAHGENSLNIGNWAIDNISLYNHYSFNPPLNLTADLDPNANNVVHLRWDSPTDSLFLKNGSSSQDLINYEVQRFDRYGIVPEWNSISTVTSNWYDDTSLISGCYDYRVLSVYREGSGISDVDSLNCISIGVRPLDQLKLIIYPLPAASTVRIESSMPVKQLRIINTRGMVLMIREGSGEKELTIDLSALDEEMYILLAELESGMIIRKQLLKAG